MVPTGAAGPASSVILPASWAAAKKACAE